ISKRIGYTKGLINSYYIRGNAVNEGNYFDLAAEEFYAALLLIDKEKKQEFLRRKALVLQGLGYSYEKAFNYTMAEEFFNKGLEISIAIDNEQSIADLYYNLGVCLRETGNTINAIEHFEKALSVYKKNEGYEDIADVYNVVGFLHFKRDEYHLAEEN